MTGFRFAVFAVCGTAIFAAPPVGREETRTVFTSTRTITAIHESPDGTVWVGTSGGVRRRDAATGAWQTFTREHGVPAHEVRAFAELGDRTIIEFADGTARYAGGKWEKCPAILASKPTPWEVLYAEPFVTQKPRTLPKVAGGQITTFCAAGNGRLFAGTRQQGLFVREPGAQNWQAVPPTAPEPANANAQAITFFGGAMYVSTLRDGLVVREASGDWAQLLPPTISSDAPRQMLQYKNTLYIRHGSGAVDRLGGETWTKNVWARELPRKQVSAFATDGERLWAAQWGGVSVYDGAKWTHYLREPGLQGVPITALLPVGDTLYIGTQGRGLAEMDTRTGLVRRWWNEAHGVSDDWITALGENNGTIYAGTFVGGLAVRAKGAARFTLATGTAGENVTDLLPVAGGGVVATTRFGARVVNAPGVSLPTIVTGRTVEAQCVARSPSGETWIGTRTGLYRVKP
ncbi:MAG: hypothetical protein H7Y38_19370 [Armatimonadetes bacterium]|nr:hypothetical protein [Armatimonadota bacterium]